MVESGASARNLVSSASTAGVDVVALWGGIREHMCSKEFEDFTQRCFNGGICGSSGIDCRCLSSCRLNESTEVKGRSLTLDGRMFHSLGAAMLKALYRGVLVCLVVVILSSSPSRSLGFRIKPVWGT